MLRGRRKRTELIENQKLYAEWLATAKEERRPPIQEEFAVGNRSNASVACGL